VLTGSEFWWRGRRIEPAARLGGDGRWSSVGMRFGAQRSGDGRGDSCSEEQRGRGHPFYRVGGGGGRPAVGGVFKAGGDGILLRPLSVPRRGGIDRVRRFVGEDGAAQASHFPWCGGAAGGRAARWLEAAVCSGDRDGFAGGWR
jgi:hypothetical protein